MAFAADIENEVKVWAEKYPAQSAASVERMLVEKFGESGRDLPETRTIQRWVAKVRSADTSGAWNPTASTFDREATRHLLDVIAIVTFTTEGQVAQLTAAEAKILISIRMSDFNQEQNIPPWEAYRLAREYLRRDGGAGDLDLLLALRPWTSEPRFKAFGEALRAGGWLPRDYTEESWAVVRRWLFADRFSPDLGPELRQTYGSALAFNMQIKIAVEKDKRNREEAADD